MKTAYELAMERLSQQAPTVQLSDKQKQALAALDAQYKAKLAEREIFLQGQIEQARSQGDGAAIEQLETQLASERKVIQAELEEKKEDVRKGQMKG
jgi:hypothetical protein